ncbi:MAG TPA: GNAT family N-acetyltransferase [Candidatus Omnitrophota bacterium]|nr:GNAT family N-acetyltransferase [Candidatus Omnitrophota bacterium]HQO38332.1 GNAT family N-acetyltransferase [Candidatus Omnitrophota bacterium]HQQ06732.1 GNAT family N-acetyltransferase [Candidatus Omnitrophota bacterium]
MRIDCIGDLNASQAFPAEWDEVLSRSSHDHVCFSFEWTKAWWEAFGAGKRLLVLAGRDDSGRIRAIAPLMQCKSAIFGLPMRKISFIYNNNASRADLIDGGCNREIVDGLVSYLRMNPHLWDMVELENIWDNSLTFRNLQDALKKAKIRFAVKEGLRSPFVSVSGTWEDYFALRSQNFHKSFRNIRNRFKSLGRWSIESEKGLNGIIQVSCKSWKARSKRDIAADADTVRFYELLTETAREKGWLHAWLLKMDGAGIAYEYALEYKQTMYAFKADFDEAYRKLSPGTMLHAHVMKYCFERGLKEIDLCGHDEDYKKRWADGMRNHWHVAIYRPGLYGMLLYILDYRFRYRSKLLLKRIGALKRLKKKMERARI